MRVGARVRVRARVGVWVWVWVRVGLGSADELLPLPLHVRAHPRLGAQLEHLVRVGLRVRA